MITRFLGLLGILALVAACGGTPFTAGVEAALGGGGTGGSAPEASSSTTTATGAGSAPAATSSSASVGPGGAGTGGSGTASSGSGSSGVGPASTSTSSSVSSSASSASSGSGCPGATTCAAANVHCGVIPDGCGGMLDCGPYQHQSLCDTASASQCSCELTDGKALQPYSYGCDGGVADGASPPPFPDCVENATYPGVVGWCCPEAP